ncbi:hypothetical protein GF324_04775 [bacterium]|nr:hypothetical protein [bacterium]
MFFLDLLLALVIAFLIAGLFSVFFGWRWPGQTALWPSIGLFFVILFIAVWLGGIWVQPFGPTFAGVAWLPFLIIGILIALLVSVFTWPARRYYPRTPMEKAEEEVAEAEATLALGGFFWAFLIAGLLILIASYTF